MSRGPTWTTDEVEFLNGILHAYGDKPNKWSEEVRNVIKARLANRSESGIYQQTLKILKARKTDTVTTDTYSLVTGA